MRPQVTDSLRLERDENGKQVLRTQGPVELTADELQMVVWVHVTQDGENGHVEGVGVRRSKEADVERIRREADPRLRALPSDATSMQTANAGPQWAADVRPDGDQDFADGEVDVFAWMWVQRRAGRGVFHVAWEEKGIKVAAAGAAEAVAAV
jgi:hypothetical protein